MVNLISIHSHLLLQILIILFMSFMHSFTLTSKILGAIALLFITNSIYAQKNRPSPARITEGKIGEANITISYSSPAVKEREIWGNLVPYNKIWRAGANEATTFSTDKNLYISNKKLSAGTYSLFIIPTDNSKWIAIFNNQAKQWGSGNYDKSKDAIRVEVEVHDLQKSFERLNYQIDSNRNVIKLIWEKKSLSIPVNFSTNTLSE